MAEAIEDAISIIKLHRPEKPVIEKLESRDFLTFCPNCGYELEDNEIMCEKCTQVINWRDNEEKGIE